MTRPVQHALPFRLAAPLAVAAVLLTLTALAQEPPPPPAGPDAPQGPCEIRNWKEVLDLWQAPAPSAGGQFLRVTGAVQLNPTEEGDAEFPIFSPTGDKLVFTISTDRSGRRANLLRLLSPERLQKASPRLLEVSSRAQADVPIFGGPGPTGIRSHDSQVYFSWLTGADFIYYSRVHERIFKGQFSPTATRVEAVQVAAEAAITLHGWRSEIYCQNLRGIVSPSAAGAATPIVKLGATLVDDKPIE
ncbi:MAG TPA: hypothetical protein P5137_09670, partial [Candidatus Brocadiia bacterium]|nr:hypothetical protein [Candidatus Brocadiia bacterium]